MSKKLAGLTAETSGAVALITALALVVICGAAALAIDLGHLVSVKNELQIACGSQRPGRGPGPLHPNPGERLLCRHT